MKRGRWFAISGASVPDAAARSSPSSRIAGLESRVSNRFIASRRKGPGSTPAQTHKFKGARPATFTALERAQRRGSLVICFSEFLSASL